MKHHKPMPIDHHLFFRTLQNDKIARETISSMYNNYILEKKTQTNIYVMICKWIWAKTITANLVVKPNCIAHVKMVFRKCGLLQSDFVCCHISDINIFTSFGFFILSARTDLLVLRDIMLMLSRSFKLLI